MTKTSKKRRGTIYLLGLLVLAGAFGVASGVGPKIAKAPEGLLPSPIVREISSPTPEPSLGLSPVAVIPVAPKVAAAKASNKSVAAPAVVSGNSAFLNLINAIRRSSSLSDVRYNATLNTAAKNKCQDMVSQNYFSHTTPQGKDDFSFVTNLGYKYQAIGSNLAKGYANTAAVFNGWMDSPEHKANILKTWGTEIGYAENGGYACMFIAKAR